MEFILYYDMPVYTLMHTVRSMRAQAMPASRSAVRTSTERQLGPSVTTTVMGVKALQCISETVTKPRHPAMHMGSPFKTKHTTHRTLAARPCSELIFRHGLENICDVDVHKKVLQGVAAVECACQCTMHNTRSVTTRSSMLTCPTRVTTHNHPSRSICAHALLL